MNILIMGETSGRTRRAFQRFDHHVVSCDLLPSEDLCGNELIGWHHQGDVRDILYSYHWDLMIAHPDCTYLTNSAAWALKDGPYHQKVKPETLVGAARRKAQVDALDFVRLLMNAPIEKIAIENPAGVIGTKITPASQFIHPWQFGDDASKLTGLWLKNLPLLEPTLIINPRVVEWPRGSGKFVKRWANQTDSGQNNLPPSVDRWKDRARTYQGISDAFANQWGNL